MKSLLTGCLALLALLSCNQTTPPPSANALETKALPEEIFEPVDDTFDWTNWTDLGKKAPEIRQLIYYATTENFVGEVLYPCGKCLLRPVVADALIRVHQSLEEKGYGLLVYDCYRPLDVQWKMWESTPDKRYVSDPRKGSMHNRGTAVDLTLVDLASGKELDMGTPYDFFGREAWPEYQDLPPEVLDRRRVLADAMRAEGFQSIRTEWWHYSFPGTGSAIEEKVWSCR